MAIDQHLRHVAEAFSPARQGTILYPHRVVGIATNTSMVLNFAFLTYIMMTADVGLPDAALRHTQDINPGYDVSTRVDVHKLGIHPGGCPALGHASARVNSGLSLSRAYPSFEFDHIC